jgi:hypothetical protein
MRNFLTEFEINHLRRFEADGPFWFDYDDGTKQYFERELRRMLDLNLIERLPNQGIRGLLYDRAGTRQIDGKNMKNVKDYLQITPQGRDYLQMRDQVGESA